MRQILDYLNARRPDFLHQLADYVRFPTVSTQRDKRREIDACAEWLAAHCESIGLHARLVATHGNPVVVATTRCETSTEKPHFLIYGHYDVQPAEPLGAWITPPFELAHDGDSLRARGASDNKGQHFAHLKAVEAYLKTDTTLPCDVTFVIEGEEEIGSPSFAGFLAAEAANLRCDGIVISDTTIPGLELPGVACSLRGLASASVKVFGPRNELHSGIYGGAVENPAVVLCSILAACRGNDGRVLLPGFYETVRPLSTEEKTSLASVPFDSTAYLANLGVLALGGESDFSPVERTTARPTFEINGLASGYQGEGIKTIIPPYAEAKISLRIVADQDPEQVLAALEAKLRSLCPPSVRMEFTPGFRARPYAIAPGHSLVRSGMAALRQSFGVEPLLLREGVTIPVLGLMRERLGAEALLLGFALPDDAMHAPNEKLSLAAFTAGMKTSAYLWAELARLLPRSR